MWEIVLWIWKIITSIWKFTEEVCKRSDEIECWWHIYIKKKNFLETNRNTLCYKLFSGYGQSWRDMETTLLVMNCVHLILLRKVPSISRSFGDLVAHSRVFQIYSSTEISAMGQGQCCINHCLLLMDRHLKTELGIFEPRHEKTCLRGLWPGKTQTSLLSYSD